MIHNSAYNVNIPFGKYKGFSLGYIASRHRSYLEWLIKSPEMPELWRILASKTLAGDDISSHKTKNNTIPKGNIKYIGNSTLQVKFNYDKEFLARFKYEIDGRVWNDVELAWDVPTAQILKLVEVFGGTNNIIADEDTKHIWREETKRKNELEIIRNKEDVELNIKLKLPLYDYQNVAVEFIDRAGGRAMVADQMGLGKTPVGIAYALMKGYKTIVACPKSVVTNWAREVSKFTGKSTAIWTSEGRLGRKDCQYHVINYDIVQKHIKELNSMNFELLICDEATYLKNRNTIRSKSVLGSYKERRKFPGIKTKNCLFLTGTPVLNRPVEAFHLLNYLDKNRFNNFYNFIERYGGYRGTEPQNLDDLHQRTKDLIIRRLKKDVLKEFPDKQRNDLFVEMTSEDIKEYNTHLTTLFKKWSQLGKPTVAEMPTIQKFLITKKMPRVIEMIDEYLESGRGILIFSIYIDPLKQLLKHYKTDAVMVYGKMNSTERQKSIDKLSSGEAKIGLFSLGAGSMGIDGIQKQIDTVIFLDHWWVPAVHEQAEDRVHRIGQNNKVQIYYMICENTIDEYMREILLEKQKIIDTVVDGKLVSIARDKSYFKEFVQKLNKSYINGLQNINIELVEDETALAEL